jgi:uncharacterized protein YgiM (DUF1202 family)
MNVQRPVLCLLLVAAIASVAAAQVTRTEYVGEVKPEKVNIRSGPDTDEYVCTQLNEGDRVEVVGEYSGWLQIKPVEGCFSAVHKEYVRPQAGSDKGTITDTVFVHASGDKAGMTIRQTQGTLKTGDTVKILGDLGDGNSRYYRIAPPAKAFWWVKGSYIRRLSAAEAARPAKPKAEVRPVRPQPPETGQATDPAETAPGQTTPAETEPTVAQDPQTDPMRKKWQVVEDQLKAEFKKPYPQRDYQSLLAKYNALGIDEDHYLHPWVQVRTHFLTQAIRQRQELQKLEEMVRESQAEQQRLKEQRTKIEIATIDTPSPSTYAAEGIIMPSEVYTGKGGVPKRFLVYNPSTLRLVAFAQSTSRTVDLDDYVGKHVGLFGSRKFDENLMLTLVDAMQVKVIQDNPTLPTSAEAKAIVPEPEPKAPPANVDNYEMPTPEFAEDADQSAESPAEADQPEEDDQPADATSGPAVEVEEVDESDSNEDIPATGLPTPPASDDPALNTVDEKQYK